jgi:hypothetical protein
LKENDEKITVFQIVGMYEIEQRSAVRFLQLKSLSKKVIRRELVAVFQENIVSYWTRV